MVRRIVVLLTVLVDVAAALWYGTGLLGLWLMPHWVVELPPRLNVTENSWAGLPNRHWFLPLLQILLPKGLVTFVLQFSVCSVAGLAELLGCSAGPAAIPISSYVFQKYYYLLSTSFFSFPAHAYGNANCFAQVTYI